MRRKHRVSDVSSRLEKKRIRAWGTRGRGFKSRHSDHLFDSYLRHPGRAEGAIQDPFTITREAKWTLDRSHMRSFVQGDAEIVNGPHYLDSIHHFFAIGGVDRGRQN